MPLFGLSANYEFSEHWRTRAAVRYLSVQVNDLQGEIFSADIALEYYFNNNWGIGMSLSTFNLDVGTENIISDASIGWSQDSAQIYGAFKY